MGHDRYTEYGGQKEVWQATAICDAEAIVQLAQDADSLATASRYLAHVFDGHAAALIYYARFHPEHENPADVVYADIPRKLAEMCKWFDERRGCPVVQRAIRTMEPFEALHCEYPENDDFPSKRYMRELQKLSFGQIIVTPIQAGGSVHVFFVGVGATYAGFEEKERIIRALGQFVTATTVRFPETISSVMPQSRQPPRNADAVSLSTIESQLLLWCARGKSSSDISRLIGLSEHTIAQITNTICSKLDAYNRTHAVAKAIQCGMIDPLDIR